MKGFCKDWKVSTNKSIEIQLEFPGRFEIEWFVFNLSTRSKQDHSGVGFNFEFLRLIFLSVDFYDIRHGLEEVEE